MTIVRFGGERVFIRIAPVIDFSEQYRNIKEIHAKTGVLKLRFADGKTISLWTGLGDPNRIAEILMQKTEVLPR